jgi:hypothetical protein
MGLGGTVGYFQTDGRQVRSLPPISVVESFDFRHGWPLVQNGGKLLRLAPLRWRGGF